MTEREDPKTRRESGKAAFKEDNEVTVVTPPASKSSPAELGDGEQVTSNGILDTSKDPTSSAPKDKYKLVYSIMVLHGVGTLIPWNLFINAKDYFEKYKLAPDYIKTEGDASWYSKNFYSFLLWAAQIPLLVFTWANLFFPCRGSLQRRLLICLIIEIAICIFTILLAILDSSTWPAVFFSVTILFVIIIHTAGGIYQNIIYGIGAKMGYASALILGSNLSGVFTSVTNLVILTTGASHVLSASFYFGAATLIMSLCLASYHLLPYTKFHRHFHPCQSPSSEGTKSEDAENAKDPSIQRRSYFQVLRQCWQQCLNVFLVFVVTLSVFPAVYANIFPLGEGFIVSPKYFVDATCFLTFNVCALLGNMAADWVQWPGPKYLWIPVTLRVLFIPFFLLCNYHPLGVIRSSPVIMGNYLYWSGGIMLGLSNGYLSSLAMIYCPRSVKSEDSGIAGMFGAAFLVTGVFVGVVCSLPMPYFV